jgi:hypothetical protein
MPGVRCGNKRGVAWLIAPTTKCSTNVCRCLRTATADRWDRAFANESVGLHWGYLRWFLAMHYRFNGKSDSGFWRACRETADVSGIEPMVHPFRTLGPASRSRKLIRRALDQKQVLDPLCRRLEQLVAMREALARLVGAVKPASDFLRECKRSTEEAPVRTRPAGAVF